MRSNTMTINGNITRTLQNHYRNITNRLDFFQCGTHLTYAVILGRNRAHGCDKMGTARGVNFGLVERAFEFNERRFRWNRFLFHNSIIAL